MKNVLMVLTCLLVILNTTAQTPSTVQRMIGYSRYQQDQQQVKFYDSAILTYSGTRGSEYDFENMDHEGWMYYFESAITPLHRYRFKADVWHIYRTDLLGGLEETKRTFTYNADNKVTELYLSDDDTSSLSHHTIFRYNGPDIDFAERRLEKNGSSLDTLNRVYFKYNGGLLVEDSSTEKQGAVWEKFWKFEYKYDMNGNIKNLKSYQGSGNIYTIYTEAQATYTSNNQLLVVSFFIYNKTLKTMALRSKDSFVYVPGVNFWVKHYNFDWDEINNILAPEALVEKQLNTQMLPATLTTYEWDGSAWARENVHKYTYNSFGNPIHDSSHNYTGGVMEKMPAIVKHFYYEEYQLGIAHTPVTSRIKVYPNPAQDLLTVSCDNAASLRIELVNFFGQTVKKLGSSGDVSFSIGDLAPGMYCLIVSDPDGNKLHQQTIVKQ